MPYISKKTQFDKETQNWLKRSYREDYFYTIKDLPNYKKIYLQIRYIIRAHGKH